MKKYNLGCKSISFLMILALILHWNIGVLLFKLHQPEWKELLGKELLVYVFTTSALFIILNLSAAIGLFYQKKWGFWIGYFAVIASTINGVSYIPLNYKWFYHYFLSQPSIVPVILTNLGVLFYLLYLYFIQKT